MTRTASNTQNRFENRQINHQQQLPFPVPIPDDLVSTPRCLFLNLKKKGMGKKRGDGISADAASVYGEGAGRKRRRDARYGATVCQIAILPFERAMSRQELSQMHFRRSWRLRADGCAEAAALVRGSDPAN